MSNTPQGAEVSPAIVDRRIGLRRPAPSLTYIDLGENNGGIILNVGEDGLAATSAAVLDSSSLVRIRFQLPGFADWLEVSGEIAWISESRKEGGLRFVDLPEIARKRIRDWVSSQEFHHQTGGKRNTVNVSEESSRTAAPSARENVESSTSATRAETRLREEEAVRNRDPREELIVRNNRTSARNPSPYSDRRASLRNRVPSLLYVDFGENNGGIGLNISEGGLAVTCAEPVYADGLARMRFQLPGLTDRLEAICEIAWISESKKQAGVRFVDPTEKVRTQIRNWIVSQAPSVKFESQEVGVREKAWRRLDMPILPVPQGIPPHSASSNAVTQTEARVPPSSARSAPSTSLRAAAPADSTPFVRRQQILGATGYRPSGKEQGGFWKALARNRTWGTVALVVIATSFFGWFVESQRIKKGTSSGTTDQISKVLTSPPSISAPSAGGPSVADMPSPQNTAEAGSETPKEPAAKTSTSTVVSSSKPISSYEEHVLKQDSASVAENPPSPPVKVAAPPSSVAPQSQDASSALSTNVGQLNTPPVNTPPAPATTTEVTSVAPKPVSPPAIAPSISVNIGPYPSIRVPAGFKPPTSQQGAMLKIGRLLSRIDPLYPADAEAQRVEGTVKLHAIIGQDGTIESVEARGGPDLLVPAAVNAVRQWRYTESSVGGQPVEAEQDISITFRLPTQTVQSN